jgi:antitoxin VapB
MIYIIHRGNTMQTAKIFQNGRSQAIRLPKEFQFRGEEVFIQKHGNAVLLIPHEKAWEVFIEGLNGFSEDFMKDGRDQGQNQEREGF